MEFIPDFEAGDRLEPGSRRVVKLKWDSGIYRGLLYNKRQSKRKRGFVYQLIWESDRDLLKRLRKTYVRTFVATSTQKEEALRVGKKKTRTALRSAMEVLVITPKSRDEIELKTFYRVQDHWTPFLEKLMESNVFPWRLWGERQKEYLYQRNSTWHDLEDLSDHMDGEMVIYYLADTNKKEIYVGKANRLGDRVKPGRAEIPGWNKFRYDVVRPQYSHLLGRIEENAIRTFASI